MINLIINITITEIILISILYLIIGLNINWLTEPQNRFNFKRYTTVSYITLFVDLFFWPVEVVIYYIVLPIIRKIKK